MTTDFYAALQVSKTADATTIKLAFRRLARLYHPDRNPGNRAAEERFKSIAAAYDVLSDPAKRSQYDRTGTTAKIVIPSRRGKYQLEQLIASGDLADIYRAVRLESGETVVVKIAKAPAVNDLLANEAARLRLLTPPGTDTTKPNFRYLVGFRDSFVVDDGTRRQVLALEHLGEYESFAGMRALFPDGVALEHGVWMFNRILEGLDYIHRRGQIHGALVPGNVLIWKRPEGHLCKIIDFGYGGAVGEKVRALSPAWKSFYPAEVLDKKPATPATDIYMAARLIQYILGRNEDGTWASSKIPAYLQDFLARCRRPEASRRPQNAWALHEEFKEYMRHHYGPKKFVLFTNPGWPG